MILTEITGWAGKILPAVALKREVVPMKEKLVVAVCLTLCAVLFASVTIGGLRLGAEADEESAPGDLVQIEIGEGSVLLPALDDGASDEPEAPWTYQEIEMLAKTVWAEARGVKSTAQQAAVVWCVLNRVDAGGYGETIAEVVSAPYQFAYDPASPVTGEFLILAEDVLLRWGAEKAGEEDVGRTLPADYLFFEGDGVENHFRKEYEKNGETWDWSLPDPYEGG